METQSICFGLCRAVLVGQDGGPHHASSHPEPLPPEEENPQPWTPLTDPQPPQQKPQHYLPMQANICKPQKGNKKKAARATHTWKRMQNTVSGVPSMYPLGFSSIRPLRCHECPPPTPVLLRKHWNSINPLKDNHGPDNGFFHLPSCRVRSALMYIFQL